MKTIYIAVNILVGTTLVLGSELAELQSLPSTRKTFQGKEDFSSRKFYPEDGCHIGAYIDYLYWGVKLDNVTVAITSQDQKSLGYNYQSGFRVGLSSIFPDFNNFVVDFEYTYIKDDTDKKYGKGFSPSFNIGSQFTNEELLLISASSTTALFDLSFNNLDITLGKYLSPSDWTYFKLFIGIQGAYIDQALNSKYLNCTGTPLANSTNFFVDENTYYWALGIKGGVDSIWYFTKQWGLMGNINASALSSHFSNRRKDSSALVSSPNQTNTLLNLQERFYSSTFVLDLILGLRFDHRFQSGKIHGYLSAGWELMIWFDLNQSITVTGENSSSENLNFQGLTLRGGLNF